MRKLTILLVSLVCPGYRVNAFCSLTWSFSTSNTRRHFWKSRGCPIRFGAVQSVSRLSDIGPPNMMETPPSTDNKNISPVEASIIKFSMISYIAFMCVTLPITLLPISILQNVKSLSKAQSEHLSLQVAQFCARSLFKIVPFANVTVVPYENEKNIPEPTIWVANHVSALDTFLLLATDLNLRGENKRPIKTLYWKGLDENPVTKMLFRMAGFIPVQMAANGSGNPNDYDRSSFKSMLKSVKQAFNDGFDILIMPEGQLNPTPEKGLLPVFSGAFALAKMSHRPIRFVGIYGSHRLWHADESIGMTVTGKDVVMKVYPPARGFDGGDDFVETFSSVVGQFGKTGRDLPEKELNKRLYQEQE